MPGPEATPDRTLRGLMLVAASSLAYAAMPILAKTAYAAGATLVGLLAWRFAIAAALFGLLAPRGEGMPIGRRTLLWGLGLVFVANAFCYFKALETTPASVVAVVIYTYPVFVALLAALGGLERLLPRDLVAAGVAVAGVVLVAGALPVAGGALVGVALTLASAFFYALYIVLSSRLAPEVTSEAVARHVAQACAAVYLPWAALEGELLAPLPLPAWGSILGIAVVCTVLALRAFLAALPLLGPTRAAVASTVEVAIAVTLAVLLLGEKLVARQWAGGALVLGAVVWQNLGAIRAGWRARRAASRGRADAV